MNARRVHRAPLYPSFTFSSSLCLCEQSSLDSEVHLFRLRTVETFLASGTPLQRMQYFRPLLERNGLSLSDHSHMRTYVPKIEAMEISILKKEINNQWLSVAFDGTSRMGEAINITGRWCSADFKLQHRLLHFVTTKHHLKGPQFASLITRVLCTNLSINPDHIIGFSRDSVSVNGAACRMLCEATFGNAENFLCICHTLNNTGEEIKFHTLEAFMTPWLELVGGRHPHHGAKALWKEVVAPQRVPGFSNTRWHSKAEIQFVLAENFNRIPSFLQQLDAYGYGEQTRKKLHTFFDDHETTLKLKLELAAMLDVRQIVRTTYELEGERLEVMLVYRRVEELRAFGRALISNHGATVLPNLDGALRATAKLGVGSNISKYFEGYGYCDGKVTSVGMFDSTLYPGKQRKAFTVKYASDGTTEDLEEEELRPLLVVKDLPERANVVAGLAPAFEYLENRITGQCREPFQCDAMYEVCDDFRSLKCSVP